MNILKLKTKHWLCILMVFGFIDIFTTYIITPDLKDEHNSLFIKIKYKNWYAVISIVVFYSAVIILYLHSI